MRKLKVDLVNQKYGRLTVVEMLPNYKKDHRVYCRCTCDCGSEVIKRVDHLKTTSSCGCDKYQSKERPNRRKDYTGKTFGHLTVVEMIFNKNDGKSYCKCLCECGKETIKCAYDLKSQKGNPPHCGCLTEYYLNKHAEKCRKDFTGKRFGRLVVKEMLYEFGKKTNAKCLCDCGNEVVLPATYLSSGDTLSCGCYQKEMITQSNTKDFSGFVSDYGVTILSRNKKNDNGTWLWNCKCGCCGNEFVALPAKIIEGHTTSCGCERRSSKERFIEGYLSSKNVEFSREHTFNDCKNTHKLRFDFYLPKYNLLIEYQGEQHYRPVSIFGGEEEFNKRQKNDQIKREYCKNNNIPLLELPYSLSDEEIKEKITNIIYP